MTRAEQELEALTDEYRDGSFDAGYLAGYKRRGELVVPIVDGIMDAAQVPDAIKEIRKLDE